MDTLTTIYFDEAINSPIDSIIQSIDVIPLELNSEHYPYGINNIMAVNNKIIVFDNKNIIYLYKSDGKYISDSSKRIGKGAGEYSIVTAMSYNKHNDRIEIATPTHLLFYDTEFNFTGSTELPTKIPKTKTDGMFFGFIHDISDYEHLLIPESIFDDNRQILLYDSKSGKVSKKIEYSNDIMTDISMQTNCFYDLPSGEIAFFPPAITNYTYKFNPLTKSLDKDYYIDYGKNGIKISDSKGRLADMEKLKSELINSNKTIPLKTMQSGKRLIVVLKQGSTMKDFHTFLWNFKTKKGYVIDSFKDKKPYFPIPDYSDDSAIYCIVDGSNVLQLISNINSAKVNMPDNPVTEGSFVLLRYVLKESI